MKLQVREARAEDREGVVAISDTLYGGTDFIPHFYNSYIADPNKTTLVCRFDDKVVRSIWVCVSKPQ